MHDASTITNLGPVDQPNAVPVVPVAKPVGRLSQLIEAKRIAVHSVKVADATLATFGMEVRGMK